MSKYILFYYNKGNWILIEKTKNGIFNHHTVDGEMVFNFIRISKKSDIRTLELFYQSNDINVSLSFKNSLERNLDTKNDITINKEGYKLPQLENNHFSISVPANQFKKIDNHFKGFKKLNNYTIKKLEEKNIYL